MIKFVFKPSNNVANGIRLAVIIGIIAAFVFKIDLTKLIFKKSVEEMKGPEISKPMSTKQYAEILELMNKSKAQEAIEVQQKPIDPGINESPKETRITVSENKILVPVTIGYRGKMVTVQMLLDTGATGVMISRSVAKRLGIRQEDTTQGTSIVADGRHVINHNTEVAFVAVGPKTKKPLQIQIMNRENDLEDGLLGMSFLADFPHMIDVKSSVIKWM
jgi:clan AA aspartic protease (TIGR02281 family)